ncbi:hypothetical protein D3C75_880080 [compost metagenome]
MFTAVLLVQGGGVGGHRAVQVDRDIRDQPVALERVQVIHEQLGTADGERGYQGNAVAQERFVDDLGQVLLGRFGGMLAIAIGRLDQQHVRRPDQLRRTHDRILRAAEVTRKQHGLPFGADLDRGRPQNMSGGTQQQLHALGDHGHLV